MIWIFVRVYFRSEQTLIEEIFEDNDISLVCLLEASKILQLLNFGEAVSINPHLLEKLFCMLDMYNIMGDLRQEIEEMYSVGPTIEEYEDVLNRLSESAIVTFLEFKQVIASNSSTTSFTSGGVQHLTRYVMNYKNTFTDDHETLKLLHRNFNNATYSTNSIPSSSDMESSRAERRGGRIKQLQIQPLLENVPPRICVDPPMKSSIEVEVVQIHVPTAPLPDERPLHGRKSEELKTLRSTFGDEWIQRQNYKF